MVAAKPQCTDKSEEEIMFNEKNNQQNKKENQQSNQNKQNQQNNNCRDER